MCGQQFVLKRWSQFIWKICKNVLITVRNSSCGKVIFSQVSVCPQGGGVHPPGQADTSPGQTPPGQADTPHPGRWPPQRTVRILLECILVCIQFGTQIRRVLPKTSSVTTITLSVTSQSFLCVFSVWRKSLCMTQCTRLMLQTGTINCAMLWTDCVGAVTVMLDHERIALLCLVQ